MEQYYFSILLEYYDKTLDNGEKSNNEKNIDSAIRLVVLGHNSRLTPFLGVRSKWKRKTICFADGILTPSPVFNLLRFIRNKFSRWSYFVSMVTNIGHRNKAKNNSTVVSVCKPSSKRLYISLLSIYVVFFIHRWRFERKKRNASVRAFRKVDFEWLITLRWRKFVWKKELFKLDGVW